MLSLSWCSHGNRWLYPLFGGTGLLTFRITDFDLLHHKTHRPDFWCCGRINTWCRPSSNGSRCSKSEKRVKLMIKKKRRLNDKRKVAFLLRPPSLRYFTKPYQLSLRIPSSANNSKYPFQAVVLFIDFYFAVNLENDNWQVVNQAADESQLRAFWLAWIGDGENFFCPFSTHSVNDILVPLCVPRSVCTNR